MGKPAHTVAGAKIAFDVGIVEPNSISHSARSGCNQSFLNVNAGTRDEERERESQAVQSSLQSARANICTNRLHDLRGHGRGFPAKSGTHTGRGSREAEDTEMKISEWVSRKRKLMWMARFGAEISKHNALSKAYDRPLSEHC